MELFHYTNKTDATELLLDCVKYFGANPFSKREKNAAGTPRTFFYLNPQQREVWFDNSKDLFSATVDDSKIYDLVSDPLKLKVQADRGTFIDMDKLFSLVISNGFIGAKFKNVQFDGVIVFIPINTTKVEKDRRETLENKLPTPPLDNLPST
jgi:hypothetical protein